MRNLEKPTIITEVGKKILIFALLILLIFQASSLSYATEKESKALVKPEIIEFVISDEVKTQYFMAGSEETPYLPESILGIVSINGNIDVIEIPVSSWKELGGEVTWFIKYPEFTTDLPDGKYTHVPFRFSPVIETEELNKYSISEAATKQLSELMISAYVDPKIEATALMNLKLAGYAGYGQEIRNQEDLPGTESGKQADIYQNNKYLGKITVEKTQNLEYREPIEVKVYPKDDGDEQYQIAILDEAPYKAIKCSSRESTEGLQIWANGKNSFYLRAGASDMTLSIGLEPKSVDKVYVTYDKNIDINQLGYAKHAEEFNKGSTITIDNQGGEGTTTPAVNGNGVETAGFVKTTVDLSFDITINIPVKEGYEFNGYIFSQTTNTFYALWIKKLSVEYTGTAEAGISGLPTKEFFVNPGETIKVNNGAGATGAFSGNIVIDVDTKITDPKWAGYEFLGYEKTEVAGVINLTAKWKKVETPAPPTPEPTPTPPTTGTVVPGEPESIVPTEPDEETNEEPEDTKNPESNEEDLIIDAIEKDQDLDKVEIDGNELGDGDFTVDDNGNISINPDYLATLPDGEHTIRIVYEGAVYETSIIVENGVPLSMGDFKEVAWSLFDLIITVLAAVFAIVSIVTKCFTGKKEELDAYQNEYIERNPKVIIIGIIAAIVISVISIVLLILTQDFSLPMAIFDKYSVIFAVIFVLQIITVIIASKKAYITYIVEEE